MDLKKILALLHFLGPVMESTLVNIESNVLQPQIKKMIDAVTDVELKQFLIEVDAAFDKYAKLEIHNL